MSDPNRNHRQKLVVKKSNEKLVIVLSQVKNQKEIKGPVGIREVSFDSRCIVLENMSDKSEFDLSGWRLERTFEGPNDDQQRKIRVSLSGYFIHNILIIDDLNRLFNKPFFYIERRSFKNQLIY